MPTEEITRTVLFAAETWPFTVAAFLMLLIAVVEGAAMVAGASISDWLQHAMPDLDGAVHGPIDHLLGWLHVGRVPLLVLAVLLLTGFAIAGFAMNLLAHRLSGGWLTPFASVPLALLATMAIVRIFGAALARVIPQDQTFAVSFESLIGRIGIVTAGTARAGYPAQARVTTEHGQHVYVMVEPAVDAITFSRGEQVLLQKQISGSRFAGIVNPYPDLAP